MSWKITPNGVVQKTGSTSSCPGQFTAATENELWKLVELHATIAHGEDPSAWGDEDREIIKNLFISDV